MRASQKVKDIEKLYGKPINLVVVELYLQEGTIRKASARLGISKSTFAIWLKEADKINLAGSPCLPDPNYEMNYKEAK